MNVQDVIDGVPGFRVSGIDAGLRKQPAPDLALIVSDTPCTTAGVFTTNLVKAAPVLVDVDRLQVKPKQMRAVLINASCANACTGDLGLRNAEQSAAWVGKAVGCAPDEVLVMSTGVIGVQLPMEKFQTGIPAAASALRPDGWHDASKAIMTTDTRPKRACVTVNGITIAGIAKGAGMIAPNMATLLSAVVTDAAISVEFLQRAIREAAEESFNRIVVDGDMSTNDTLLVLANGASGKMVGTDIGYYSDFLPGLTAICKSLAQAIVRDAEGGTKFIELVITGARSVQEAKQIGNTIATSPLVKTAFYGGDANWGRILAAAGRAGVVIDPNKASLWYGDLQLMANGMPLAYDDAQANGLAAQPDVHVRLDLGLGDQQATIWTCDLSHEYVSINGHYRT